MHEQTKIVENLQNLVDQDTFDELQPYVVISSEKFPVVLQSLTNGEVTLTVLGRFTAETINKFITVVKLHNSVLAEQIESWIESGERSKNIVVGTDKIEANRTKMGVVKYSFTYISELNKDKMQALEQKMQVVAQIIDPGAEVTQEFFDSLVSDLADLTDQLLTQKQQKLAEISQNREQARVNEQRIMAFQSQQVREQVHTSTYESEVMEIVRARADENVRRIIIESELPEINTLIALANEKGISQIMVSGTSVQLELAYINSDTFWQTTFPQLFAQLSSHHWQLVHNMKSEANLEKAKHSGAGAEVSYPASAVTEKPDVISPYLRTLNGGSARILFSILAVDLPRYRAGSAQGGSYAQLRIPLNSEMSARTIFFPSDTGDQQARLDIQDTNSTQERAQAVMDSEAAKVLFILRHIRLDIIETITKSSVRIGNFVIIEGNTLGAVQLDPSSGHQIIVP